MLEGLAVWAFFIWILKLCGIPWAWPFKTFAYVGGTTWLFFVWFGLISYSPMDMSGASVVQRPHVQMRQSTVVGKIDKLFVVPNQKVNKGDKLYSIESEQFEIALEAAEAKLAKTIAQQGGLRSDMQYQLRTFDRYKDSVSTSPVRLDMQHNKYLQALARLEDNEHAIRVAKIAVSDAAEDLKNTVTYSPQDGLLGNFNAREGQFVGRLARINVYTNEKYVLMRINHQALRNISVGNNAEFTSAVYPAHVFSAKVEAIIEVTGESQANMNNEAKVSQTTGANRRNKHHFVRLKLDEGELNIPMGAVGYAWVQGAKPHSFLNFLDAIRGIIIRMKAQLYLIGTV